MYDMNLGSWGKGISCYRSQIYFSDCVIYCRSHIGYPSRIFFSGFVAMQDFFFLKFCFAGFFFLFLDSPPLHISNGASLTTKDCWCLAKIIFTQDDQHCSILLAEFNISTQSKKNLMTFSSLTKNISFFRRKLSIVSLF